MLEFFCLIHRRPPSTTLFPYTTLFRSDRDPLRVDREVTRQEVEREPERSSGSRGLIDDQHEPIETEEFSKPLPLAADRKSTRLNSSHVKISYAVFCLKKKKK